MITTNKISFDEANEIISDIKNRGNGDLTKVMDFLNEDFEETKNLIVELTKHLDNIETLYDNVLKEYNLRNNELADYLLCFLKKNLQELKL
jgi:hypothetical protein